MDLAILSSEGDPRLSLMEPFICSLLLCSARFEGLEFK